MKRYTDHQDRLELHGLLEESAGHLAWLLRASLVSDFLAEMLAKRQRDNPAYSLRAFAKDLRLDATDLSKVLRRQKSLAPKTVLRISAALGLTSDLTKILTAASAVRE